MSKDKKELISELRFPEFEAITNYGLLNYELKITNYE